MVDTEPKAYQVHGYEIRGRHIDTHVDTLDSLGRPQNLTTIFDIYLWKLQSFRATIQINLISLGNFPIEN